MSLIPINVNSIVAWEVEINTGLKDILAFSFWPSQLLFKVDSIYLADIDWIWFLLNCVWKKDQFVFEVDR